MQYDNLLINKHTFCNTSHLLLYNVRKLKIYYLKDYQNKYTNNNSSKEITLPIEVLKKNIYKKLPLRCVKDHKQNIIHVSQF